MTSERKSHPYLRVWVADIVQSCQEMTPRQFGAHVRMLLHAWDRGYCSADPDKLTAVTGPISPDEMLDVLDRWKRTTIDGVRGEVLINSRLEHERTVMIEQANARSAAGRRANQIRWGSQTDPSRIPIGSQTDPTPDSRLQTPDTRGEISEAEVCAARNKPKARKRATDPLVCTDEGWQGITDKDRADWGKAFPDVDLDRDLAKAHLWVVAKGARKKNWRSFLLNWFSSTQSEGGNKHQKSAPGFVRRPEPDRSHIPEDCAPGQDHLFWDGTFPNIPSTYTDTAGNLRHTRTRQIICAAEA